MPFYAGSDKAVSFNEEVEVREVDVTEPVLEINEVFYMFL